MKLYTNCEKFAKENKFYIRTLKCTAGATCCAPES